MGFHNIAARSVFMPLNDAFQGLSISKNLYLLEESQFWSRTEHENYQNERLKDIIHHAYNEVPWYRENFKIRKLTPRDITTIHDLPKLPVVTKEIIRQEGWDKFTPRSGNSSKQFSFFSSGSTGEPFLFYLTRESYSMKYASAIRGWQWMGYQLGDPYAKLSQNTRKGWQKKLQDIINRSSYYYIADLKPDTLLKLIHQLDHERPAYIRCYPDPLFFMARIMQKKDIKFSWVKAINTTGNILHDEARQLIEKQFGCKIFDGYSCEGSAQFFQVNGYDGYLGSMETAVTEVIDEMGHPVAAGETGRHITTELWNLAMPFIRYDTRDLVILDKQITRSNRNLFSLKKIIGRESDILVTPDGNLLIVHLFTIYFEYFKSIEQFQVEQTDEGTFIFRLVVNRDFSQAEERKIKEYWKKFLGSGVKVNIEIHDQIPLLYSGKRRFLIRNKDIELPQ